MLYFPSIHLLFDVLFLARLPSAPLPRTTMLACDPHAAGPCSHPVTSMLPLPASLLPAQSLNLLPATAGTHAVWCACCRYAAEEALSDDDDMLRAFWSDEGAAASKSHKKACNARVWQPSDYR